MSLAAGTRLGPYEIAALLGAGGMGEVYRARDARLGRDVAIKVLPSLMANDPDRLRRFEVEAKAAVALPHPNVLAVLDVGRHDGMPYVVSELLEGETLGERMRNALPLRKVLDLGAQIARGLAAAHDKGIVHRDLKPANLFVTRDGGVKILDFGLAKLVQPETLDSDAATRTAGADPGTTPGAILGTVGYMSPEQVKGLPADYRSDIFSFGVILFEMLAGRRAFQGETAPETMTAILRHDPLETEAAQGLPPGLARIARRCLQKDPSERFQSTHDLAFDLASLTEVSATAQGAAPVVSRRRRLVLVGGGLLLLAAISFLAGRRLHPAPTILRYHTLTTRQGVVWSGRFAPDGDTIIYSAEWPGRPMEVFSTWGTGATSRPLGLTDAKVLAVSPQGELAVILRPYLTSMWMHRGTLARVPVAGGTPRELAEDVQDADWSPDGQSLAAVRWVEDRCRLEYPLGTPLYEPAPPTWVSHVRVSPRGDRLAFAEHTVPGDTGGVVVVMEVHGGRRAVSRRLRTLAGLSWSPGDGTLFFSDASGGSDAGIFRMAGGGESMVLQAGAYMALLDAGRTERLLTGRASYTTVITGHAPGFGHEQDLSESDHSFISDLSADGTTLVGTVQDSGVSIGGAVFLRRTDGSPSVRLGDGDALALSRNGKWVLARLSGKPPETLVVLPTGAGEVRELPRGEIDHYFEGDWFPDSGKVLFQAATKGRGQRLFVQDVAGGLPRAISAEGYSLPPLGSSVSPDGRRATVFGPDGTPLLQPLEGGEPLPIAGLAAGDVPVAWTTDGRGLFSYNADEDTPRLQRLDLVTGRTQLLHEVMSARPTGMIGQYRILVSANGRSYVYSYSRVRVDLMLVEGLP
jgi:eukaryotic-like serine/threonine-protein kinase